MANTEVINEGSSFDSSSNRSKSSDEVKPKQDETEERLMNRACKKLIEEMRDSN